jgi:hypothetical protein
MSPGRCRQDRQPPAGRLATFEQILPSGAIGRGEVALAKFSTWYAGARALGGMRRREQLTTLRGPHGTPIDAAA